MALLPAQGTLVSYIGQLRTNTAKYTDERVRLAGEAIAGCLAVKMLGETSCPHPPSVLIREACIGLDVAAHAVFCVSKGWHNMPSSVCQMCKRRPLWHCLGRGRCRLPCRQNAGWDLPPCPPSHQIGRRVSAVFCLSYLQEPAL